MAPLMSGGDTLLSQPAESPSHCEEPEKGCQAGGHMPGGTFL